VNNNNNSMTFQLNTFLRFHFFNILGQNFPIFSWVEILKNRKILSEYEKFFCENLLKAELEILGFKEVFAKEFFYSEYYSDIDNFSLWLESVPIFKDFDPTKDRKILSEYVEKMKTQEGIELKRHRVVIVVHKT